MGLTLQRDLAKFFFSCSETVAWMFRSLCLPVIQQCSRALLQKKKKNINNQHICICCCSCIFFCSMALLRRKKHSQPTFAFVVFGSRICFLLKGIPTKQRTLTSNICICVFYLCICILLKGIPMREGNISIEQNPAAFVCFYLGFFLVCNWLWWGEPELCKRAILQSAIVQLQLNFCI